jgi:8-oxo-dGTP diphosphatase
MLLQFGEKIKGTDYTDRPGAYAIIFNEADEIAVMKNPQGFFLPGGGTDGEDPATALAREIFEEAGMGVRILKEIGVASQFCLSPGHDYGFNKIGTFFIAAFTEKMGEPVETDHELVWLSFDEAHKQLTHAYQKWAISKAVNRVAA